MEWSLSNVDTLLKIAVGFLTICTVVGSAAFALLRRQWSRVEKKFDDREAQLVEWHEAEMNDLLRDNRYLARQLRDVKESRAELREDLRRCLERSRDRPP